MKPKEILPFVAGLVMCLFAFCLRILGTGLDYIPGDLGDCRFILYLLEHNYLVHTGKEVSLWSAPFMHPSPEVVTLSDNMSGSAVFYSLFRICGIETFKAFQLWFILINLLNYTLCYFFLRYLSGNPFAAVCGALVFSCSMALHSQMSHPQTFVRFAVPLAFWMAFRFFEEFRPWFLFACALAVVYQLYCSMYIGMLLIVPLVITFAVAFLINWQKVWASVKSIVWWLKSVAALVLPLLLLLPLMLPYLRRSRLMRMPDYQDVLITVPEPISRLYSKPGNYVWDFLRKLNEDHPLFWYDQLFPGGVALIAVIICAGLLLARNRFENWRRPAIIVVSLLLTTLMFTRFGRFSFYNVAYNVVPGYASMRVLERIMQIELLFYAACVSFLYAWIANRVRYQKVTFLVFLGLLYVDTFVHPTLLYRWPVAEARDRVEQLSAKLRHVEKDRIISYEPKKVEGKLAFYQIDAMLACQQLGLKTINGYSSSAPAGYTDYWFNPNEKNRRYWSRLTGLDSTRVFAVE